MRRARGIVILPNRAAQYRRLARECLALVQSMSSEDARRSLIEMARVWTRLADEQAMALPPMPRPEGSQPAVQQQQQVQPEKDGAE